MNQPSRSTWREEGSPAVPPVVLASYFHSSGDPAELPYTYGRIDHPNWRALEHDLGALEDAEAVVFASGQAASMALLWALTPSLPRLLIQPSGYYNTRLLAAELTRAGIEVLTVDPGSAQDLDTALDRSPGVVWIETPTNPLLTIHDIAELGRSTSAIGGRLVVDNTAATAVLQRPLDLGASAVITSLTKAASGHSDVLLGSVTTRDGDLASRLRVVRSLFGAIPGPFETWLAQRGLATLAVRMRQMSDSAMAIARHLYDHPDVTAVYYPGFGAARDVAARQMKAFGSLVSFEVLGGPERADRTVAAARVIHAGTSFGGVSSSWERRARWPSETAPPALIRLSVGIEPLESLLADIDAALKESHP